MCDHRGMLPRVILLNTRVVQRVPHVLSKCGDRCTFGLGSGSMGTLFSCC